MVIINNKNNNKIKILSNNMLIMKIKKIEN